VAAAGLTLAMILAVFFHLKKHDKFDLYAPASSLCVLAVLELIFRLS
jgi:hypothetical protein